MRECKYYEVTVEKLLRLVHSYTDPIRICVVMGDAWLTCDEAKHMIPILCRRKGASDE